jgi:hypothetical protein
METPFPVFNRESPRQPSKKTSDVVQQLSKKLNKKLVIAQIPEEIASCEQTEGNSECGHHSKKFGNQGDDR